MKVDTFMATRLYPVSLASSVQLCRFLQWQLSALAHVKNLDTDDSPFGIVVYDDARLDFLGFLYLDIRQFEVNRVGLRIEFKLHKSLTSLSK